MSSVRSLVLAAVCLAVVVGVVGVASGAVPDARVTVDEVTVTPEAPDPGETTTVEVTIGNSPGSISAAAVENVTLQDGNRTLDRASSLGALSPGDDLTVPLSTAFEETGVRDLAVVVNATDEDGAPVTVRRPLTLVVGGVDAAGIEDDVRVDVREARPSDFESEDVTAPEEGGVDLGVGDLGGALGGAPTAPSSGSEEDESSEDPREGFIAVEVANLGTATARNVVVDPGTDALPRRPVEAVPPGETRTVLYDAARLDGSVSVEVTARYDLASLRLGSTATYEREVERPSVRLTDVDMVAEGGLVEISGNVANVGDADAEGVVVEVGDTEFVGPTYPQRSYFVGTVPESDFVGFDLTARVDPVNATTVPVRIVYVEDGVERQETVELPYEPREGTVDEGGPSIAPFAVFSLLGLTAAGAGTFVWRRRDGT